MKRLAAILLCTCGILPGCSTPPRGVSVSDPAYHAAIVAESAKAVSCAGGRPMGLRYVRWNVLPGDPARGYRGYVEYGHGIPPNWIGAQTHVDDDSANIDVWVDPRNPSADDNRRRYQWEWKNCLTHEHAGRATDGKGPEWMDWNFRK